MQTSTTRNGLRTGSREQMAYSFSCVLNRFISRAASYLTHVLDWPLRRSAGNVRDRQLQILIARLGQQRCLHPRTNIPTNCQWIPNLCPSFCTPVPATYLCHLGKRAVVPESRHSLFCALLATLQQYWARRYLRITQTQCAIHKRARLRAFFAEGVEHFQLPFVVETIPTLIHISMFLFLTGLVISLFSIHHTIARIILVATVVCGFIYTVITVMPVLYRNSPYQYSVVCCHLGCSAKMARIVLSAAWYIVSLQKHTGFIRADSITALTEKDLGVQKASIRSMTQAAEDAADEQDWRIDARALSWTLDQSDEESELEKFIAGIARFAQSKEVEDPIGILKKAISGSKLHRSLYRDVTNLLINAADPGLLRGSKPLPGP
jgi:hypothetical protein